MAQDNAGAQATDPRVPVTLLTGFLGAGKTSLLNAVLSDAGSGRIAVIVNEFGEAGLDHDLIEAVTEEVILMQSGCLCCSIRGDLARTVQSLLERRDAGDLAFERIVIETTGMADPGPILQTLQVDGFLSRRTRMDGVVTVADAANGPATLDAQFEAVSQVAMADLVVLSKPDLVTPERLLMFEERLRTINPGVPIVPSVRGKGVPERIWALSGLRHGATPEDVLKWARAPAAPPAPLALLAQPQVMAPSNPLANLSGFGAGLTGQTPVDMPHHDTRIGTASIILDDPIPDVVFDLWLDTLISLRGPDILRVKGIVFLEDIETPFVFHGVQHIFDPPVPMQNWPKDDRRSRIVVIARDMSRPELQRSLDMLRGRLPRKGVDPTDKKVPAQ